MSGSTPLGKAEQSRIVSALISWEEENGRCFPWRAQPRTPYKVLVSELLLKRTTSTAVARVFPNFINRFPDVQSLTRAKKSDLEGMLAKLGLQSQRSRLIIEMAGYIVKKHGNSIPNDYQSLIEIPAVGDYTASAILSFGYGRPSAIVDSNVQRVISRVFGGRNQLSLSEVKRICNCYLPKKKHEQFNYGLLDLGAMVCRNVKPRHDKCPLRDFCEFIKLG